MFSFRQVRQSEKAKVSTPSPLVKVDRPPQWVQQFSDEIDALNFGPGFDRLDAETRWSFGVRVESLKTFFHKIDDPLESTHERLECWSSPETHVVRGVARVEPKDRHTPAVDLPFVWIFYMHPEDPRRPERVYIVNGPVKTDAVL